MSGWCHRIRDHGGLLFIDLRDHYGITQVVADPDSSAFKEAEKLRCGMGGAYRREGAQASCRHGKSRSADRRGRGLYQRDRGARARRRAADAGVRGAGISRGDPAQVSFPRSAPRASPPQHHEARRDHRFDPPPHEGAGIFRVPDADPDRILAGRRARLSGAVAPASGKVLRAAAGAAAVQAAHHGVGFRPLFSDRALLSRRGCARRSFARGILSARPGDELRHPAGRVRCGRAGDARRVRGVCRRQAGDAEISAHSLCRGDAQIRLRQAGSAQPAGDRRPHCANSARHPSPSTPSSG